MLRGQGARLGAVSVEQTLTQHAAGGEGLQASHQMVALVDALGVDGGVPQDLKTLSLVLTHEVIPQNWDCYGNGTAAEQEPEQLDAAGEGHADENEHEDQGNTGILGDNHVYAH